MTVNKFSLFQGLAYASPTIAVYFLMGPITILQGMYAKFFGLSLSTIAVVMLVARIFDAVSDPLVGHYSDRYYARYGSRKPIVIIGGLLFVVSSWFLYVPPANVSGLYFLFWFIAFYFSYTLFVIPHYAWGSDLAADSLDRNKLYSFLALGLFLGTLLFFVVPLLPLFESTEFTPVTLAWAVFFAGLCMLPALYLCAKYVPDTLRPSEDEPHGLVAKESPKIIIRSLLDNYAFRLFTCAHICTGFGLGMWFALLFLFVENFLKLGEKFAILYAVSFASGILLLKMWYQLAQYFGKQKTWAIGMAMVVVGLIGTGLLSVESGWVYLLLCMSLVISGLTAFQMMVPSLLADIVDYGTWKFGSDRSATYFSIYTLVNKAISAVSSALGFVLADWYGFNPVSEDQTEAAIFGVRMVMAWLPLVFVLLSIVFILLIPITVTRHNTLRRRLKNRAKAVADQSRQDNTNIPVRGNDKHVLIEQPSAY